MNNTLRALGAVLLTGLAISGLRADDWPQWMGPQRDGVWRETGILDKFPAKGPTVKWRVPVAAGYSGPAVADGRVFLTDFVTTAGPAKEGFDRAKVAGTERVLCFDAKGGKLLWKHEHKCTYRISYPVGPRCTPTVHAGKVYALGAEGLLLCLDAEKGTKLWSRDLKADYKIEAPFWGFAGHPLVDGKKLICLVGGEGSVAVAFDKDTGKELWKALSAQEPGYSSPTIIEAGGKRQLLIWHPESVNGLDPETGKSYWSVEVVATNGTSIMAPRQMGDRLYVGGWGNKAALLELAKDRPEAKLLWRGKRDTALYPVNGTPFVEKGYLYGVCSGGELRCVELATGKRLWESYAATGGAKAGSGTAHLVKHGDRFFLFSETGHLIIAKLSPKGYEEISRCKVLEPTTLAFGRKVAWAHPAFAGKCAYARNDRELVCVSLEK